MAEIKKKNYAGPPQISESHIYYSLTFYFLISVRTMFDANEDIDFSGFFLMSVP